jgi:hypothetical protein
MKLEKLLSIGFFAFIVFLTLFSWKEIIEYGMQKRSSVKKIKESFANEVDFTSDAVINNIIKNNEPVPTDAEAVAAHQTLLRYIRNDFSKGINFVSDFGKRFYGDNLPLRSDLDVRILMDNYRSPL